MDLKVSVEGLNDLKKAFDQLPARAAKKASSKAVREGAKVIQKAARAKVPVDTGNLKRSISVKVLNKKRDALQVAALIGPGSGYFSKRGKNAGKKLMTVSMAFSWNTEPKGQGRSLLCAPLMTRTR